MRIKLACHYCDHRFEVWVFQPTEERLRELTCPRCDSRQSLTSVLKQGSCDAFGYNYQEGKKS